MNAIPNVIGKWVLRYGGQKTRCELFPDGATDVGWHWSVSGETLFIAGLTLRPKGFLWTDGQNILAPIATLSIEASQQYQPRVIRGVGWHLTELIAASPLMAIVHALAVRIDGSSCQCKARAELLDRNGPDWAEAHGDEIVGWLREGHATTGSLVPFSDRVARTFLDDAIAKARAERLQCGATPDNQMVIVCNSDKHGFGDAAVMAWVSEGSRHAAVKLIHHATGAKRVYLELFGQDCNGGKRGSVDTFGAYSAELRAKGVQPRMWQRGRYLGVTAEPQRPHHTLTVDEIDAGRSFAGNHAVLLWPNTDYGTREWPPFYWLELAERLHSAGYRPIMCGGGRDRRYDRWEGLWGESWRVNAAVMLAARCCVGNDSGPAHTAGTLHVPTVVPLGPTTPNVFCQYGSITCIEADVSEIGCRGCYFQGPGWNDGLCSRGCLALAHIDPSIVFEEVLRRCTLA